MNTFTDKQKELLLEQETFNKFGYWPVSLSRGSPKKVIHRCDICGEKKETPFRCFLRTEQTAHLNCKTIKCRNSVLIRYGVENVSQVSSIKTKKEQTALKHYGVKNISRCSEIREKAKETCLRKYGVTNVAQLPEMQKNIKQSNMQKYGVEHFNQLREQRQRIAQNRQIIWLAKHGIECDATNISQVAIIFIRSELLKEGYQLLSNDYINNSTKIEVQCPKKNSYWVTWSDFQQGYRCPCCSKLRKERVVREILDRLYPGKVKCQDKLGFLGYQRVDFSIRDLHLVVEYDGEQHFKMLVGAFGCKTKQKAQERLIRQQRWDRRKEKLCKKNGYRIIRIRYDEKITEELVKEKIARLKQV